MVFNPQSTPAHTIYRDNHVIGITTLAVDESATHLTAKRILSGKLTLATGRFVLTYLDANGATKTAAYSGQEAVDFYNALAAIKAGTFTAV